MQPHPIFQYLSLLLFCLSAFVAAQQVKPAPPLVTPLPLISPEVHADGSVTFRFRAPNAQEVKLDLEGVEPVAMQKDDQGVWAVTPAPLAPDYYGYSFLVDGVRIIDPQNPLLVPNLLTPASAVHVPGPTVAALGVERRSAWRSPSPLL